MAWQHHIADVIVATEKALPNQHLISQNIANGSAKITQPHPAISIFNFHYASPPTAVAGNYALNKVIGDNETGFKGTNDTHYRMEAWGFMLAGGALYNNLDYSFIAGFEDGTFVYPAKMPGGGNPDFRRQMKVLKEFIHAFDFIRMKPDRAIIKGGFPDKAKAYALVEAGRQYAIYLAGGSPANLQIELPAEGYTVEWINTKTGNIDKREKLRHPGGTATLASPTYVDDIALRIVR